MVMKHFGGHMKLSIFALSLLLPVTVFAQTPNSCITDSRGFCLEESINCTGNYATDLANYYWPVADLCKTTSDLAYNYGYYLGVSSTLNNRLQSAQRSARSKDALIRKLKAKCGSRCRGVR
jgi:predicted transcriptional regulator of viral defense system